MKLPASVKNPMHCLFSLLVWLCAGVSVVQSMECTNVNSAEELLQRATTVEQGQSVGLCIGSDAPR